MKKPIIILQLLLITSIIVAQNNTADTVKTRNYRNYNIENALNLDTLSKSPLLESLNGISVKAVKNAYTLNSIAVDSILTADSLNPNFWRTYSYQFFHLFKQANKSPSMAMAIMLPWFVLLFIIVGSILKFKTIFLRPEIGNARKPDNDLNKNTSSPD